VLFTTYCRNYHHTSRKVRVAHTGMSKLEYFYRKPTREKSACIKNDIEMEFERYVVG